MDLFFSHLISGAIAGVISDVSTHPFSTIKTRLQVQGATGGVSTVMYKGPLSALASIVRTEGVMSLYKGVGIVVLAAAPSQALYFGGYETVRTLCGTHPATNFAAGIVAQFCGSLAWVPMDVVKERLQIEGQVSTTANYGGSITALRNIVRLEGVRGLYRAYWMHQLTWAPFNGCYFSLYEQLKTTMLRNPIDMSFGREISQQQQDQQADRQRRGELGALDKFLCAVTAGTVASTVTSPIDLVKTRLQVQASNPDIFDYKGPIDATLKIVKREGILALFDGVGARMLWLTPRLSIAVSVYEACSGHVRAAIKKNF